MDWWWTRAFSLRRKGSIKLCFRVGLNPKSWAACRRFISFLVSNYIPFTHRNSFYGRTASILRQFRHRRCASWYFVSAAFTTHNSLTVSLFFAISIGTIQGAYRMNNYMHACFNVALHWWRELFRLVFYWLIVPRSAPMECTRSKLVYEKQTLTLRIYVVGSFSLEKILFHRKFCTEWTHVLRWRFHDLNESSDFDRFEHLIFEFSLSSQILDFNIVKGTSYSLQLELSGRLLS